MNNCLSAGFFYFHSMKNITGLLVIFLISCNNSGNNNAVSVNPVPGNKGEELFRNNCVTCHSRDTVLTGPVLTGVLTRWKSKQLLYEFVRNPIAVLEKDNYSKNLQNKYHGIVMTSFPQLSDQDIDEILKYCGNE